MAEAQEYQLEFKNKFGNFDQFTDENGLQLYPTNVVINHMTGQEISQFQIENLEQILEHLRLDGYRLATEEELQSICFNNNIKYSLPNG